MQLEVRKDHGLELVYQTKSDFVPRVGDIIRRDLKMKSKAPIMQRFHVTDVIVSSDFKKASIYVEELSLTPKKAKKISKR